MSYKTRVSPENFLLQIIMVEEKMRVQSDAAMAELQEQLEGKRTETDGMTSKFDQLREEAKSRINDLKARVEELGGQLKDKDKQVEAKVALHQMFINDEGLTSEIVTFWVGILVES